MACSPQAWAAAAPFAFLSACIGLEIQHDRNRIRLRNPTLPAFLEGVSIFNLKLGESRIDLRVQRYGSDVTVNVLRRVGDAQVSVVK